MQEELRRKRQKPDEGRDTAEMVAKRLKPDPPREQGQQLQGALQQLEAPPDPSRTSKAGAPLE